MVEIVTFTGVDERTPMTALLQASRQLGRAEFGVLAGSASGAEPRFPRLEWIADWKRAAAGHGLRTALHLCGRLSRAVRAGEIDEVLPLCAGFGRVQVNLPAEQRRKHAKAIRALHGAIRRPVILQHDGPWPEAALWNAPGIEHLFDRSGGRGKQSIESWPEPPETTWVGYAGGIGPETIGEALAFAARFPERRLWLDMESGIRTDDWLDTAKVEAVADAVRQAET